MLNDKERMRRGEEINPKDKKEIERGINQQTRKLMSQGIGPGDAFASAIENARRGGDLDSS